VALPDRGSLIWLEFSPQAGTEQAGRRPGIVLTPLRYHQRSRLAIVCPITHRERGWPMEVLLPAGLPIGGVVLVDHVRSVDREARKMEVVGAAPQTVLDEIDARLAPLLGL
jgi:mRNA interferase MazF